jgi:hypothetical protein
MFVSVTATATGTTTQSTLMPLLGVPDQVLDALCSLDVGGLSSTDVRTAISELRVWHGVGAALDARLRDHANAGDPDAFVTLGNLLAEALADFHAVARKHPDLAAKVKEAFSSFQWEGSDLQKEFKAEGQFLPITTRFPPSAGYLPYGSWPVRARASSTKVLRLLPDRLPPSTTRSDARQACISSWCGIGLYSRRASILRLFSSA